MIVLGYLCYLLTQDVNRNALKITTNRNNVKLTYQITIIQYAYHKKSIVLNVILFTTTNISAISE